MDPISIAMGLAEFVRSLIGWFTGDKNDADKADKVLNIVKRVTGIDSTEDAISVLRDRPDLLVQLKESVMAHQIEMARENTKRIESVNRTMQSEGKSEHWMQWSWRPFNGFLFGLTLFLNYVVPSIANILLAIMHVTDKVPDGLMFIDIVRTVPIGVIPEFVLVSWAAILGVTSWTRGKEKLENKSGKLL